MDPETHTVEHVDVHHDNTDSGMGFFLGIIVLLIVVFLLFYYGLPAIRSASSGPTLNVPSKVDVNVNKGTGQ